MISRAKVDVLRKHILHESSAAPRPYAFRADTHLRLCVLEEMEESGLIEVARNGDMVTRTRITPAGVLCFLREVNRAVGKKSGRDYFREFFTRNPDFLDRCGPVQRARVEKYLVLGYMPSFSKKPEAQGQQDKETQP